MTWRALTRIWRTPVFAGLVAGTLALGVGPLGAIVGIVDHLLLRPLPYPAAHRLVVVNEVDRTTPEVTEPVSVPNLEDWESASRSFKGLAAFFADPNFDVNLTGGSEPERVPVIRVTWDYFDVLDVEPAIGRSFLPEEDEVGRHRVAILSHGLWERRFGRDPEILDRTVEVNGFPYRVVGVLPPSYRPLATAAYGEAVELWRPVAASEGQRLNRDWRFLQVVGRLAEGTDLGDARRELAEVAARLERRHPDTNRGRTVSVGTLRSRVVGDVRGTVLVLLGGVAALLFIACVNVSGLVLVRSARRRREMALRAALGASPGSLLRLTLVEMSSAVAAGIVGGLLLARVAVPSLVALAPGEIPFAETLDVDLRVALVSAAVAAAVTLAVSVLPVASLLDRNLRSPLQAIGSGAAGDGRLPLRALLVGVQVGLAFTLLVCAGLVGRSFGALTAVDPGFDADGVLTFQLELPMVTAYPEQSERDAFFDELLTRLRSRPEVIATGRASVPPMAEPPWDVRFAIPGHPASAEEPEHDASLMLAGPGYFPTLGIDLLQGRIFDSRDDRDAPRVVVVNRTLADRFWPDGLPPGRSLLLGFGSPEPYEIVGVVEDVHLSDLAAPPAPTIYWPTSQHTHNFLTLFARTAGDPGSLIPTVRRIVEEMDPLQPVYNLRPLHRLVLRSAGPRRFAATILGVMAGLAALLAGVGLFGTVSHAVRDQTREIGIRLALGSSAAREVGRLVAQVAGLVLGGLAAGLVGARVATGALGGLLFRVERWDPVTFVGVSAFIALICLVATLLPARRAASVDPVEAIREG